MTEDQAIVMEVLANYKVILEAKLNASQETRRWHDLSVYADRMEEVEKAEEVVQAKL